MVKPDTRIQLAHAALKVRSLVRDVPDFPKPGILFRDITPVLKNPAALDSVAGAMMEFARSVGTGLVAGIESRGFIFGVLLAHRLGIPFIPIRKKGKLPYRKISESYDLEYGQDTIEMHVDAAAADERVLIVDDLMATGGTLAAAVRLVEKAGAAVAGCCCVIELGDLGGRGKLNGYNVHSIVTY
jgi:adenine phosphoribosyltransferase